MPHSPISAIKYMYDYLRVTKALNDKYLEE